MHKPSGYGPIASKGRMFAANQQNLQVLLAQGENNDIDGH
jgi:hypothetical protein